MKSEFKKVLMMILVIMLCAAATITGFTVSAAHRTNAPRSADENDRPGRPALKNGVWQAKYENGDDKLFFINEEERSFSLVSADMGVGLPSRYDYDNTTGIYKLSVGYEGNEESWRVIDNSGSAATVSNAHGDIINLHYISGDSAETFHWYTLGELREMARRYYEANHGDSTGVVFTSTMCDDGSFFATITATKDHRQAARYTVDMVTAKGNDEGYHPIDLSLYSYTS